MKMLSSIIKANTENLIPENIVLGVAGSPRRNGNSDVLMRQVLKGVKQENIECSLIQLRDIYFQGCIGCEKCRKDKICTGLNDGMSLIYSQIITSKGLVLVSPTHNYNITSWMKAFIDRLYCFYNFKNTRPRAWSSKFADQDRKAVLVAVCEQENVKDMGFTLEAMRTPIEALGYQVIREQAVFRIFDKGKVKEDTESLEKAFMFGKDLAKSLT
ncbi:flavodoxin family protein [Desulfonatronum sp. SC1]|uniref:flavodoxin family protein n=1 Tax=Desulfonatronum sp. SC1 TaxID=2109626 RepID=UPI000D305E99|nr:flavodoxin family protein [Desulfonatronum sp. SC1]PTN38289.1 flavodoxin family protein [Desulfonatronum sp. SC1]